MNSFINALQTRDAFTENGMVTHSTSGGKVLDLFYHIGGSRELGNDEILSLVVRAFDEDPLLTVKNIFYNRDIRGGQGERRSFRIMFNWLCSTHPDIAIKNLPNVPFYGRWDDLFEAIGTPVWMYAFDLIASALKAGDKLCAKWMPRENKKNSNIAHALREYMGLTPKQYRKLLAGNTQVVENFMCKHEWGAIDYNHIPSMASAKYRHAFGKHDFERYSGWLASLEKPESGNKIHADAIFPHTIVQEYLNSVRNIYYGYGTGRTIGGVDATLEAQWKALPDYVPDGQSFIPVCDLSGSMSSNGNLPMAVSASLGIYLSQRNKGPFKDAFITFSRSPSLQVLSGNLMNRLTEMRLSSIAENTNLELVFKMILEKSVASRVPANEMPNTILIISDMQFDQCIARPSDTAMDMIRRNYSTYGYTLPNVVFWNVNSLGGVPVKIDENGTALVSGFSPSVMKNLLSGEMRPDKVMLNTLMSERYALVTI
jgi:hypothetical protein